MKKVLWTSFSLLLFSVFVWLFTVGRVEVPESAVIAPQKLTEETSTLPRPDYNDLKDAQTSPERKVVIEVLGKHEYAVLDETVTLEDGVSRDSTTYLSQVFFAPYDLLAKDIVIGVLGKETSDGTEMYLFSRFPRGTISEATFIGTNTIVDAVNIENGIISLTYHTLENATPEKKTLAFVQKEGSRLPSIEDITNTVVLK